MILVVGGTGTVGSEVVKGLLAAGEEVRALVRSPERGAVLETAGVELAIGDLDAPETLPAALDGVDRAFIVVPASPEQAAREAAFAEAAAAAGDVHVVKLSVIGADPDAAVRFSAQHGQAERALREAGCPHTLLRPNDFMQNSFAWAGTIRGDGRVYTPNADTAIASVDARDISASAVAVLTGAAPRGRVYELSGPDALTRREQVARVAAAIGREVEVVALSSDEARDAFLGAGVPEYAVAGLYELWEKVYDAGYAGGVTPGVREATGRDATGWDAFARDHAEVWR